MRDLSLYNKIKTLKIVHFMSVLIRYVTIGVKSWICLVGMKDEDISLAIKCLDRMLHKRKQVCSGIMYLST